MTASVRRFTALILLIGGLVLASAMPASAQSYEGSDTDEGVFEAPSGVVVPGGTIEFTATGLEPFAVVNIVLLDSAGNPVNDTSNDLSIAVAAGPGGTVNTSVAVPPDLDAGSYSLSASSVKADGSPFSATYPFAISAAAQPTPEANQPGLAFTGASSLALALGASMLILLGGGLVLSTKPSTANEQ